MHNIIDLFAGAGGLSLGACRAGFSVISAVEWDSYAIETHKINFPKTIHIQKDIMTLKGKDLLNEIHNNSIDGVIGGPPCQGFSNIGKGNVDDERNQLFIKFFKLVNEIRPKFFLAENVPGIMQEKYDTIRNDAFSKVQNYIILPPMEISANEYGAPTTRKRIFFFGYLPGALKKKISVESFLKKKKPIEQQIRVRQALEGLPYKIEGNTSQSGDVVLSKYYYKKFKQANDFYRKRIFDCIPKGVGNKENIDRLQKSGIITGMYPTVHRKDVQMRYQSLNYGERDAVSKSVKLNPNMFCPTIRSGTGPEKGSYQAVRPIHYAEARVITPREAARLQGFPDWFVLPHTIWHSFRQIGNSVSPIVAEEILSVIFETL